MMESDNDDVTKGREKRRKRERRVNIAMSRRRRSNRRGRMRGARSSGRHRK